MEFIQESGFTIKQGKEEAFQQWLVANEQRLAATYPEGTGLIGVYAVTWTSEKEAGAWRMLERRDSYGALDRLAAAGKDRSSDFAKLSMEMAAFGDWDRDAPWSQVLLKRATDATIWDPPQEA